MQNFKEIWVTSDFDEWITFDQKQLDKAPFTIATKEFLAKGYPKYAAPFLDFGLDNFNSQFISVFDYYATYPLDEKTKHFWFFGSDDSGNIICIDTSNEDKIVLLDHEQEFEPIQTINKTVIELAQCLLLFKNFITLVNTEFGDDGFFEKKYTSKQITDLEAQFKTINPNLFEESDFWKTEFHLLKDSIS